MQIPIMIKATVPSTSERPHAMYKRQFLDEIIDLSPSSLLDVGCGTGDLLLAIQKSGVSSIAGIEPDIQACAAAQARLPNIILGRAEELPFEDRSFDVVTLEYVAHHVENLPKAMREAARVANTAVLLLDCWFDETIPSQRVARRYDDWLKRLDRKAGYIHNPCPTAAELTALCAAEDFYIDYSCRVALSNLNIDEVYTSASALIDDADDLVGKMQLQNIMDDARREGMSNDGCISARYRRK